MSVNTLPKNKYTQEHTSSNKLIPLHIVHELSPLNMAGTCRRKHDGPDAQTHMHRLTPDGPSRFFEETPEKSNLYF